MSEHIVGVEPKEYKGKKYRSTLEANTAEILDLLGLPWEYETKRLTLQEGFYCDYQKRKVQAIEYIPDFMIGPIMLETKGWETPDWKLKKKLLYKYLKENDPTAIFYMVKNSKQLLQVLDNHWPVLGLVIQVTPKPRKSSKEVKKTSSVDCDTTTAMQFSSIQEAFDDLHLKGKSIAPILHALTGKKQYVYGYNWKLTKQLA